MIECQIKSLLGTIHILRQNWNGLVGSENGNSSLLKYYSPTVTHDKNFRLQLLRLVNNWVVSYKMQKS